MMQLQISSIQEMKPGKKWEKLFNTHWNAYKTWFQSKGAFTSTSLKEREAAVKKYMPKFYTTYKTLCELAGNSSEVRSFLSGYNPPAYISGCSQLAYDKIPLLIRNYDYHPNLCEGTLLHSSWHGKQVIATGDCLIGAVDGINEDGIAISLTFGGSKSVGKGFGIPFIIRYALEFSSTLEEAVEIISSIPSHMAYNVAILDKTGNYTMVMVAPNKKAIITKQAVSTNHQQTIDWPEHASFSKTVEREAFLNKLLKGNQLNKNKIVDEFLKPPLFSTRYSEGFGTIYSAVYLPAELSMEIHWKGQTLSQSLSNFKEGNLLIDFSTTAKTEFEYIRPDAASVAAVDQKEYANYSTSHVPQNSLEIVLESLKYVPNFNSEQLKEKLKHINSENKQRGEVPWEIVADFWKEFGKAFV